MVFLFYVYGCLIFSPSKDKINGVYASLQSDFKIEDDGELNKYIVIDLDCRPYGSIHIIQTYINQGIINIIPGMENSSNNPTPAFKPLLEKNEGTQMRKITLITYQ